MTDLYTAAVAAHQAFTAFDAETDRLTAVVAAHQGQRDQLQDRRTKLAAQEPRRRVRTNGAAVAALLADASSPIAIDDTAVAEEGEAARVHQIAHDRWNAEMAVVNSALFEIDAKISRGNSQLATRPGGRGGLWVEFVRHAHTHLFSELERVFVDVLPDIVEPLLALAEEKMPGASRNIISATERRLCNSSVVRFTNGTDPNSVVVLAGRDERGRAYPGAGTPVIAGLRERFGS